MQCKKFMPNNITFIGVLSACNHCGLVEEGKRWFKGMEGFGLIPQIEQYGWMVDLLGRAGCLEEVDKLIERIHKLQGLTSGMLIRIQIHSHTTHCHCDFVLIVVSARLICISNICETLQV
ncbi:hypothetical protein GBA52_005716 [Prunus armeniaca]|nr:hypothetical protein GBA52_005716 [Prunus armeniaca]